MTPETQYARAGDAHIAYQVLGDGPIDIVLADQWFSHKDLVAGSGISFTSCGAHALKGVPGKWRLFSVADAGGQQP